MGGTQGSLFNPTVLAALVAAAVAMLALSLIHI